MTRRSCDHSAPQRGTGRPPRLPDNLTLVPASLLPFKAEWLAIARGLPPGQALLVVPAEETPLKRALRRLVPQLRARGRHVTAVSAGRFC